MGAVVHKKVANAFINWATGIAFPINHKAVSHWQRDDPWIRFVADLKEASYRGVLLI